MAGHELWDQFDALNKKTEAGIQLLRDFFEYFNKQAKLEGDYGKALVAFSKETPGAGFLSKNPPVNAETKTFKAALLSLQQYNGATGQHIVDFSTKLTTEVIKNLDAYIKTKDAERKKFIADGQRFLKSVADLKAAAAKAQSNYIGASKEAEAAREVLEKIPQEDKRYKQAETKANTLADKAKQAESTYQLSVDRANEAQNKSFADEMPPILEGLKQIEADRFKHLQQALKTFTTLKEEAPNFTQSKLKEMIDLVEAAAWDEDWSEWVASHKPAKERPDAVEFVPFQGKYTAPVEKKEEHKKEEHKKEEPKKEEPKKEEPKKEEPKKEEPKKEEPKKEEPKKEEPKKEEPKKRRTKERRDKEN